MHDPHALTDAQIEAFHGIGCIGPFSLDVSPAQLEEARAAAAEYVSSAVNPIYDQVIGRDLHLFSKPVHALMFRPEIKRKIVQLLGDRLVMWRSDVFPKPPGAVATPWHQADEFLEFTDHPLLEHPDCAFGDWSTLWQTTVWIALEDSTSQNGCLEIIPGTHKDRMTWPVHGEEARQLLADTVGQGKPLDPDQCIKRDPKVAALEHTKVQLEAKAGEYYIFTQRVVHGSGANDTQTSRLAINFRVIHSEVPCYRHYLGDGQFEMLGVVLPLQKWGCLLYAGDPPEPEVNRILEAPA